MCVLNTQRIFTTCRNLFDKTVFRQYIHCRYFSGSCSTRVTQKASVSYSVCLARYPNNRPIGPITVANMRCTAGGGDLKTVSSPIASAITIACRNDGRPDSGSFPSWANPNNNYTTSLNRPAGRVSITHVAYDSDSFRNVCGVPASTVTVDVDDQGQFSIEIESQR